MTYRYLTCEVAYTYSPESAWWMWRKRPKFSPIGWIARRGRFHQNLGYFISARAIGALRPDLADMKPGPRGIVDLRTGRRGDRTEKNVTRRRGARGGAADPDGRMT